MPYPGYEITRAHHPSPRLAPGRTQLHPVFFALHAPRSFFFSEQTANLLVRFARMAIVAKWWAQQVLVEPRSHLSTLRTTQLGGHSFIICNYTKKYIFPFKTFRSSLLFFFLPNWTANFYDQNSLILWFKKCPVTKKQSICDWTQSLFL